MSEDRIHTPEDQDDWLNDAFQHWDAEIPADKWSKLDQSLAASGTDPLAAAFEDWDAGEPSDDWSSLDESLSVESVWNRIDQSILEEHAKDTWLSQAHASWNPQPAADGWPKLNDALSIEQVWTGLNSTLDLPVATRIPFVKLIAATVAMLFAVSGLKDAPVNEPLNGFVSSSSAEIVSNTTTGINETPIRETNGAENQSQAGLRGHDTPQQQLVTDHPEVNNDPGSVLVQNDPSLSVIPVEGISDSTPAELVVADEESSVDPLNRKYLQDDLYTLSVRAYTQKQRSYPWTIQIGTQLSILQEMNQSNFTSTLPKFGVAADLSFRHRVKSVQLIHALGISQYSQDAGKYINGRYATTQQHINTLQLSSSIGYSYRRLTVYGGLLFSKVLNGLESNQSKVTKVYSFRTIELGATAGIDFKIISFPVSGKHISVGAQYQWIPNLSGPSQSFENLHGIRFQTKFSF